MVKSRSNVARSMILLPWSNRVLARDLKVLSVRGSKCGEKLRKGTVKFCVLVGANAEENCGRGRDSVKTIIKFDH